MDTDQQEKRLKVIQLDLSGWSLEKWEEATEGQESSLAENFPFPSPHRQNKSEFQQAKTWKLQKSLIGSPVTYNNLLQILKQRSKGTPSSIYFQFLIA